jgi:predicted CXXCH cytochrome family protein
MKPVTFLLAILLLPAISGFNPPGSGLTGEPNPCLGCHGDLMKLECRHEPAEKGCQSCHVPSGNTHPGSEKGFLPIDRKKICLDCHISSQTRDGKPAAGVNQLIRTRKFLHPALKGGCVTCHLPHSSSLPNLLNTPYPDGPYAPAVKDSFELCFQCHDSDLLEKEVTTTATGFRNGDQNLHFKHMHGEKGRNCTMCHEVHAADNEHLVAEKVLFGNWNLPVSFQVMENGGRCSPGCHEPKQYKR